jgi:hypothetical protein
VGWDGDSANYSSIISPNLGDQSSYDKLFSELYGSGFGSGYNGQLTGTFDLSAAIDSNYASCSRCFLLIEDVSGTAKYFFQQSGSLVIAPSSDQLNGTVNATLSNVTLIEVTVDPATYTSTPVPNGECLHLASAAFTVALPVAPAAWTCPDSYYGDGGCDCGCGVVDLDCDDATVASCGYCSDGCSQSSCPGTIKPANNAVCLP